MKFYIDTNIVIDFIIERGNFFYEAKKIFELSELKKISIFISSHTIATAHYICKKHFKENEIRQVLEDLLLIVDVIAVDEDIIKKSLKSHHKDFEDAIQIFCAHQVKNITGIVTRNIKDFSTSEIPVFAPDEALDYIRNN
ncbi:type II toxin-antitoxin system VapC family toxin [Chryseobacterium caseinilyticum]|uniref:PIN domain-containing protein n=1 Tax=Chryseobacterium caseinilyticum TaxID=2771428 RepID=A0ABR8Z9W1_9FLAO|nr:PIN domain-containing protein [Chryseobacterium caseinilyticum]MBD8081566.1 PIN domain-containing protein [Chryseobacterium caseinilyticum]